MATRSHIYIEHNDGLYTGTYCHYDGYPEHKAPALLRMSYDSVYAMIITATTKGVIRNFNMLEDKSGSWCEEVDYIYNSPEYLTKPYCIDNNRYVDYIYIKRKNGSVEFCNAYAIDDDWTKVNSLEDYFEEVKE